MERLICLRNNSELQRESPDATVNHPGCFVAHILQLLTPLLLGIVLWYMNDIVIYSKWNKKERKMDQMLYAGLAKYESSRSLADASAVSKLSPYIHFGQVSARQVLAVVGAHGGKQASKTFWRRLVWRDLAYWQLFHWPNMSTTPIRSYEGQVNGSDYPNKKQKFCQMHDQRITSCSSRPVQIEHTLQQTS